MNGHRTPVRHPWLPADALTGRRGLVSIAVILVCSLAGGFTAAVAIAGRALPTSASARWLGFLMVGALILAIWAFLYAHLLHHRLGMTPARSLYLAALGHIPLLAGLAVPAAVYSSDVANYVYSVSVYGQIAYQRLTLLWLAAGPLALQGIIVAALRRQRVLAYLPALAPVIVALALRLWGAAWQLPYQFHDDERTYLSQAMMNWAHSDLDPHRFVNPSLMFYLDMLLFNLLGGRQTPAFETFVEALGQHVVDPRGMNVVVLGARVLVALFGTGTIAMVYLSARELLSRKAALFAAWFLAVSFLHVRNSHYGTNDVAATFFATASFLFAVKLYRTGRPSHYLWAGILGGLATTTKYNLGLFILPIFVAHLARQKSFAPRSLLAPASWLPLAMSYAVSALAFVAGTPYSILDWSSFLNGFVGQYGYGASPWFAQESLPTWWMHLTALIQGLGLLPLLLALMGFLYLERRMPRQLALVAVFPAVYYAFMSHQALFFARFTIPMLPFVAILAGIGAAWMADWLSVRPHGRPLVALAALVVLAQPLAYSIQSDWMLERADTRVLADQWIAENLPSQSVLFIDNYAGMRPSQGWPIAKVDEHWFTPTKDPAPWEQLPQRPVYVITGSFGWDSVPMALGEKAAVDAYQPLWDQGHLVISFNPGWGQQEVPYSLDDTYTPFWQLVNRERTGPALRLYRIDGNQ